MIVFEQRYQFKFTIKNADEIFYIFEINSAIKFVGLIGFFSENKRKIIAKRKIVIAFFFAYFPFGKTIFLQDFINAKFKGRTALD